MVWHPLDDSNNFEFQSFPWQSALVRLSWRNSFSALWWKYFSHQGRNSEKSASKIVQIIPIFNYGRCLTSFKNLSVLAIQQTEMEQRSQNCHRLHQFRCWVLSQGSWGHALPLPSVSSCFQKCLSQKGWMKNKSPCISPVQTCSCKMALHDWAAIPNLAPPAFQTQNHTLRRWFARIVQWLIIYPVKRPQTVWRVGNQCLKLKKQATLCVRPYTRTSYQDIKEKFTSSSKGDLLYRGYLQDLHREDFTRISRRSPHKDLHKIIQCRGLLNEDLDTRIRVQDHVRTT